MFQLFQTYSKMLLLLCLFGLDVHTVMWAATVKWGSQGALQQERVLHFSYYLSFYLFILIQSI